MALQAVVRGDGYRYTQAVDKLNAAQIEDSNEQFNFFKATNVIVSGGIRLKPMDYYRRSKSFGNNQFGDRRSSFSAGDSPKIGLHLHPIQKSHAYCNNKPIRVFLMHSPKRCQLPFQLCQYALLAQRILWRTTPD